MQSEKINPPNEKQSPLISVGICRLVLNEWAPLSDRLLRFWE